MSVIKACSADEFAQADDSCSEAFSPILTPGAALPCGKQVPPVSPCDIDDLILQEIPGSQNRQYELAGESRWSAEINEVHKEKGTRAISCAGQSAPAGRLLEVTGTRSGAQAKATRIKALVYPHASHGDDHVSVCVWSPHEDPPLRKSFVSVGAVDFDVFHRQDPGDLVGGIFDRYWPFRVSPVRYEVAAASCGWRDSGAPVGSPTLFVDVYPDDQYELKLKIPPKLKKTGGRSGYRLGRQGEVTTKWETEKRSLSGWKGASETSSQTRDKDGLKEYSVEKSELSGGVKDSYEIEYSRGENGNVDELTGKRGKEYAFPVSIELTANELELPSTDDVVRIYNLLCDAEKRFEALHDTFAKVPQLGWGWEVDVSLLSGELAAAWGWREHTDHRVYYAFSGECNLVFIEFSCALSFGVKIGNVVTAKVEGTVKEASVALKHSWDFRAPDISVAPAESDASSMEKKVDIDIPMIGRLYGEAGIWSLKWRYEGGVRGGINGEAGLRLDKSRNFELFLDLKWKKTEAYVLKSAPDLPATEHIVELLDEKPLCEGKMPL